MRSTQPPIEAQAMLEFSPRIPRKVERFDGDTFVEERDGKRLTRQLDKVRDLMMDGKWRTLNEIAREVQASESSVSARLRDLRKPRFGGHTVERQHLNDGLFHYRMVKP